MATVAGGESQFPTLTKSFVSAVDSFANPRMQMYRAAGESGAAAWKAIPAKEVLRRVAVLSSALIGLGIQPGDRVAIFAPNCPEWHIADFAILGGGAVDVPVYFNEAPDRISYILNDSGARIVFCAGEAQAKKLDDLRGSVPNVEQVICVAAPVGLRHPVLRYEDLIASAGEAEVAEYRRHAEVIRHDQLATIIYTSGTTGDPKGVMLSQANMSSNAIDSSAAQTYLPGDVALSLLPLAHVYERVTDYSHMFRGVSVAYVEQLEMVAQSLLEVRPTIAAAVPRLYEKIYANVVEKGHQEQGIKRKLFDWALRVAEEAVPWRAYGRSARLGLKVQWAIAGAIVYKKIRAGVGGNIRFFISGGAPLAVELAEFFWSIGVPIYQGYGLTETSPVISVNTERANKVGTVGPVIPNVQVKIAEDGEVLVKGACVMQGYYKQPDQTREVFTADGWFCTGDIGKVDADGYLSITDRKKELLKTAGGKYIAPAPIENRLKTSPYIANAMVVGDKRKFAAVLIVPNAAGIEAGAKRTGKTPPAAAVVLSDPWVHQLIESEVERLTASMARYEKPKRFALIDKDFTFAGGELTYTMKLKRRVIEERYKDVIAKLYADVEEPRPQVQA
jgi:long-chain acyl-CoA synthetase